jgi:hypothetical protein
MSKSLNRISGLVTQFLFVWRVRMCWPLLWLCRPFCNKYTKFRIEDLDPTGSGSLPFFRWLSVGNISPVCVSGLKQGRLPGAALSARPAVSWCRGIPQVPQQRHTGEELLRYQPSPLIGRGGSHVIEMARVGHWRQIISPALWHFSLGTADHVTSCF